MAKTGSSASGTTTGSTASSYRLSSHLIPNLLDKMQSLDKDFRFMALNDLLVELQKNTIEIDHESEVKVLGLVLQLLFDKNGEVQNLAVKCLTFLSTRVKEESCLVMLASLTEKLFDKNDHVRDVSCMCLKNILTVSNCNPATAALVHKHVKCNFEFIYNEDRDKENIIESLEILSETLKFGNVTGNSHLELMEPLLFLINSRRALIRKRAFEALASLALASNKAHFNDLVSTLYNQAFQLNVYSLSHVQAVAYLSRAAGFKFSGEQINAYYDAVKKYLHTNGENSSDEVRDYCLQIFDALLHGCSYDSTDFIKKVLQNSIEFLSYDPNYSYASEPATGAVSCGNAETEMESESAFGCEYDELEDEGNSEVDDEDEDEDDCDYSDDEDISWKVRKSALKCLESSIVRFPHLLNYFHERLLPELISRLKERKENVKSSFVGVLTLLLKTTYQVNNKLAFRKNSQPEVSLVPLKSSVAELYKHIIRLLHDRSVKIRQDCIYMMQELVKLIPNVFSASIASILNGLLVTLRVESHENTVVRLDALVLCNDLIRTHDSCFFFDHVAKLIPIAIRYVNDYSNKIAAEAMTLLESFVKILKKLSVCADVKNGNRDYLPTNASETYIPLVYDCASSRLQMNDVSLEIKEKSVYCVARIFSSFYSDIPHMSFPMEILLSRLRNETIRLHIIKGLVIIAKSEHKHTALSAHMNDIMETMLSFLKKNNRSLRVACLFLIHTFVEENLECNLSGIIAYLHNLIQENDLKLTQVVMNVLSVIVQRNPASLAADFGAAIMPEVLKILKSPLLQGASLNAVLNFFTKLTGVNSKNAYGLFSHPIALSSDLVNNVVQSGRGAASGQAKLSKQAILSTAKVISITLNSLSSESSFETQNFILGIFHEIGRSTPENDVFYLITIGEIGKKINLAFMPNLTAVLINDYFSHTSEDVKLAASYAYGILIVGNLDYFLPLILDEISEKSRKQYLLLNSLRETISYLTLSTDGKKKLSTYIERIYQCLIPNCNSTEEGARNAIAECLAKITLISPESYLHRLKGILDSERGRVRGTIITAFKCIISEKSHEIDPLIESHIEPFLSLIHDSDITVRRYALLTLNAIAHNNPKIIYKHLTWILPALYSETEIKPELIREVEMGPFRHTVDDGLDHRKTAYECMYTLLNTCTEYLDLKKFIYYLQQSLNDHYDIKMIAYLMISKLTVLRPNDIFNKLDSFLEQLMKICSGKLKTNAVKQESEKLAELKKAALRTAFCLLKIPEAQKTEVSIKFYKFLQENVEINSMYAMICRDDQHPVDSETSTLMPFASEMEP